MAVTASLPVTGARHGRRLSRRSLFHAMDFTARQRFTIAAFTVMDAGKAIHGLKRYIGWQRSKAASRFFLCDERRPDGAISTAAS